jgi:hypothetical protein
VDTLKCFEEILLKPSGILNTETAGSLKEEEDCELDQHW